MQQGHTSHCPAPARALQQPSWGKTHLSRFSQTRHSFCFCQTLLKREEAGQELSTDMQVQTQARKVVFQVEWKLFFLSTRRDVNLDSVSS